MVVLIDSINQWYRAYCATDLEAPGGPLSIISYMIKNIAAKFGSNNLVFCWDCGDSGRKALDPSYKAGRTHTPGVLEHSIYFKRLISSLGFKSAYLEGYEADDIIGSLAADFNENVYIVSSDKDFYQLVSHRVRIYKPKRNFKRRKLAEKVIGHDEVVEDLGCKPNKIRLLKAFQGDKSDNLPKIGIRFAKNFKEELFRAIDASSDIDDFYRRQVHLFSRKFSGILKSFEERARLNYELCKIKTDLRPKWFEPSPSRQTFDEICNEFRIDRLRFDKFVVRKTRSRQ